MVILEDEEGAAIFKKIQIVLHFFKRELSFSKGLSSLSFLKEMSFLKEAKALPYFSFSQGCRWGIRKNKVEEKNN